MGTETNPSALSLLESKCYGWLALRAHLVVKTLESCSSIGREDWGGWDAVDFTPGLAL